MRRLLHSTLFRTFLGAIVGAGGMLLILRFYPNLLPAGGGGPAAIPGFLDDLGLPLRLLAAAAIWMVYEFYWSLAARGAAAPQAAESQGSRLVHVTMTSLARGLRSGSRHSLRE